MKFKHIIKQIAKEHNVSAKEVKKELEETIKFSMNSSSSTAKNFWEKISHDEKTPTIEEFIVELSKFVKSTSNN